MEGLRTWLEIDTKAVKNNLSEFGKLLPKKCGFMAVVKSNAYGHGLADFSGLAQKSGADWFCVDSIVEAEALRKKGIKKPTLVLGHTLPEKLGEAAKKNISITVSSREALAEILKFSKEKRGKPLKIHIKIDTGMHRQGFLPENISEIVRLCRKLPKDSVEGIYTHFAEAKNPSFPQETKKQISRFQKAAKVFEKAGFRPLKHAAATSGTLLFPEARFDMVRIGIGLYGLWPSKEVGSAFSGKINLKPALSWKTVISEVKNLPGGTRVGYDFTETLRGPSRVAIIPVGYWHGYPRILSSIGNVLVGGKRAKILGRVTMDMITIDVTGYKKIRAGDTVTLIGHDGRNQISADELADLSGTINYEIVTRINPLIKRIYI